jgi:hypothetical protein
VSGFDDDFAAADEMFAEAFGVSVEYLVGGEIASTATAEVSLAKRETRDSYGAVQTIDSRDYLFTNSELTQGGVQIVPESGHRIREVIGGVVRVFEVMEIAGGPCWEAVDPDGRKIIVHTKEVS